METRRYAIIGTGAVGGYYGGLLCRAGFDVHFLLRSDLDHVRAHGLRVDSKHGDFHISDVNAYGDAGDLPPCDVILVCLKTIHNGQLAEFLRPPALTGGTVIVLMQNGIGYEHDAAKIAPDNPVLPP